MSLYNMKNSIRVLKCKVKGGTDYGNGSTGTINITPDDDERDEHHRRVQNADRPSLPSLNDEVAGLIRLMSAEARQRASVFYTDKIEPATGEGLTKLLDALYQICEGTLKAIPADNGLDDQLGEGTET